MSIDTKAKMHMDECNTLCHLLTESGEGKTPEFEKRCRAQLRDVVAKLWGDYQNHMTKPKAKGVIWTVLSNGLSVLRA
jgi:hypothetical protein